MRARDKKARDGVATGEKKRLLRTRLKSIEQTPSRARPFRVGRSSPTRTTDAVSDFAGKKDDAIHRFASPRKVDFEKAPVVRRFAFGSSRPTAGRGHR
jgi:hypothetical protein